MSLCTRTSEQWISDHETQLLGPEQHSRLEKARKKPIRAPGYGHERQFVHRAGTRLKAILPRKSDLFVHLRASGQVPIRAWTTSDSGGGLVLLQDSHLSNAIRLTHNIGHHHKVAESENAGALNRRF